MDTAPDRVELERARAHTDALFDLIDISTLYARPIADRHRLIFYLGHLDAFDWNQIARDALGEASFQPTFDRLFEAGIDPAPGQAPQDTAADWPSVEEVRSYVRRARERLDAHWDDAPAERRCVAIEHRWMHAETICYLLHQLPTESMRRASSAPAPSAAPSKPGFVDVSDGRAAIGQGNGDFGWDNEFPARSMDVPAFSIGRYKVTNGEYLRFVEDGGDAPPFWRQHDGQTWLRRMFDEILLPLDAPVYATHRQASAYAEWAGGALPSEAEWHRAAYDDDDRRFPWGDEEPAPHHGHFDFLGWDPLPVSAHRASASAFGAEQMIGNGWEWTSTPFAEHTGFVPRSYYPGYSANFFDGEHWVLKGGSPRTARRLLRRSFRNWFRGDYPYAYTAFRLVKR